NGVFVVDNFWKAINNPDMPIAAAHMWVAAIETTAFVVGGISAWYIWKRRFVGPFLTTFKICLIVAIIATPLQIFIGDTQGLKLNQLQPEKLAAIEAHWTTNPPGQGAPWNIIAWPDPSAQKNSWELQVPYVLSILETRSLTGQVKGLKEFPPADRPPIVIPFYAFRLMVLIGFLLFFVMLWTVILWARKRLTSDRAPRHKWLLYAWMAALPLGYLAVETGWLTREEGRQPWVIYHVLRTSNAYSNLPPWAVALSLVILFVIYVGLGTLFLVFAKKILMKGPNFPETTEKGAL
ncbi:MAG TPA: cytochrome ubiquinol oxidase subunit I, partial [Spirochaetia bacterium]|nr:cytochrome ubiquinol oxidase subunit I [Spirochaetia bacterium]